MSLLDIVDKKCIITNLQSLDKQGAINELAEALSKNQKVTDKNEVVADVMKREEKGSTGIGKSIAVPHAKTKSVKKLTLAIGISKEGVDFNSIDNKYVHIIFLLLAPPSSSGPHVEALAEIARLINPPAIRDRLKNSSHADEVVNIITEYYNS